MITREIATQTLCSLPETLHPLSASALDQLLAHQVAWVEFVRYFTLPNSDYLALADCILAVLTITT